MRFLLIVIIAVFVSACSKPEPYEPPTKSIVLEVLNNYNNRVIKNTPDSNIVIHNVEAAKCRLVPVGLIASPNTYECRVVFESSTETIGANGQKRKSSGTKTQTIRFVNNKGKWSVLYGFNPFAQ